MGEGWGSVEGECPVNQRSRPNPHLLYKEVSFLYHMQHLLESSLWLLFAGQTVGSSSVISQDSAGDGFHHIGKPSSRAAGAPPCAQAAVPWDGHTALQSSLSFLFVYLCISTNSAAVEGTFSKMKVLNS